MSKVIRLDNDTYDRLQELLERRQTYSDAVDKLLRARQTMLECMSVLEGALQYRRWCLEQTMRAEKKTKGG